MAGGVTTVIEPFIVRVFSTQNVGTSAAYVSTLNGASSDITLEGTGSISVNTSGNVITIGGDFLTSSALVPYLSSSTAASTYYPLSNPSGYCRKPTGENVHLWRLRLKAGHPD